MKPLFLWLFLAISSSCGNQQTPQVPEGRVAKVIAVKDGDTLDLLTRDKFVISVRLNEIDCPEKKQAFGQKAKAFTSDFCFGKYVRVEGSKKDGYGRLLADIYDEKGRHLNYLLVENGLAWKYLQYSKSPELGKLEENARRNRVGLWAEKNPISPWEFRKLRIKNIAN